MLPESIRGIALAHGSIPLAQVAGGSDMCLLMCVDEPGRLAAASGLPIESLTYAFAMDPSVELGVMISAIRFPGVRTSRLIDIRMEAGSHSGAHLPEPQSIDVGKRTILWVTWGPFNTPYDNEYLYPYGDVLFLIAGWPPDDGQAPRDVTLAVAQLP
jgi:hypothetical protein